MRALYLPGGRQVEVAVGTALGRTSPGTDSPPFMWLRVLHLTGVAQVSKR